MAPVACVHAFWQESASPGGTRGLCLACLVLKNLAPAHQWHRWPAYTRSGKNQLALAVRGAYAWTFFEEQSGTRAARGAYAWTFCEEQSGTRAPMVWVACVHAFWQNKIRSTCSRLIIALRINAFWHISLVLAPGFLLPGGGPGAGPPSGRAKAKGNTNHYYTVLTF